MFLLQLRHAPGLPQARRPQRGQWRRFAAGIPVPCGYLHRGPVSSPAGGGLWLIVVGINATHLIVHDPFGEADLMKGTTLGGIARFCRYFCRRNFARRWMVEGDGSGWAVLAET